MTVKWSARAPLTGEARPGPRGSASRRSRSSVFARESLVAGRPGGDSGRRSPFILKQSAFTLNGVGGDLVRRTLRALLVCREALERRLPAIGPESRTSARWCASSCVGSIESCSLAADFISGWFRFRRSDAVPFWTCCPSRCGHPHPSSLECFAPVSARTSGAGPETPSSLTTTASSRLRAVATRAAAPNRAVESEAAGRRT